jgi:cobaltochelatase CobS
MRESREVRFMYIKHNRRTFRASASPVCPNCGTAVAYWAHDSERLTTDAAYCSAHNSWAWVYLTSEAKDIKAGEEVPYRFVHYCPGETTPRYWPGDAAKSTAEEFDSEPEHASEAAINAAIAAGEAAKPKPEAKPDDPNDPMTALKALIRSVAPEVDMAEIERMVDYRLAATRANMITKTGELIQEALGEIGALPTRVEVKRPDGEVRKVEGLAHSVLPDIIKILALGENILMVGPAGTGKSHIGKQASEALDTPFYAMSVGPTMLESKLLGYMDATGNFVPTAFYEWTKKGGVFLLDEVDNGNPSVLNVLNSALSNKFVLFPNGELVELHESCLCIAAANTYGTGPDRAYVGRQALDAAFRDRFAVVDVPVDLALEQALCKATGLPDARVGRVLAYVRHLRKNAEDAKLPVVIGQRKAVRFCRLLNAGYSHDKALAMALSAGISPVDWGKITSGAPRLYSI